MKIFGIANNYPSHNNSAENALFNVGDPVVFTKADSALLFGGKPFFIPSYTQLCEYETELVVKICHLGRSIPERFAHRYYEEITVGIDFTARDVLNSLAAEGKPWDIAKGFDGSAVVGEWIKKDDVGNVQDLNFHLDINGQTVQTGHTADMFHKVDKLVSYISQFFMLKTGDLIFTGTPTGVGQVNMEDHLEGYINDRKLLEFNVK